MTAYRTIAHCAAAVTLATACSPPEAPGRLEVVREVVGDFLGSADRYEVELEHPEAPVITSTVAPLGLGKPTAPVLPALVAAPPSIVHIDLPAQVVPGSLLRLAVGFDAGAYARPAKGSGVNFEVLLDGRSAGSSRQRFGSTVAAHDRGWHAKDIPLDGVRRVTLKTTLEGHSKLPLEAAWGKLQLLQPLEVRRHPATPERPNLVLVLIDTLRADRLGAYGYDKPTSPAIDAFAAGGTRFTRAFADSSWTWPSTASLLTSLPPPAHGLTSHEACFLAQELVTLPEVLRRAGLHTGAFSSNPLVSTTHNFQQGFESFAEYPMIPTHRMLPDIEAWLRAHVDERFFLYLHITDPHGPYRPDPALAGHMVDPKPSGWKRGELRELFERRAAGEEVDMERVMQLVGYISSLYDGEVLMADLAVGRVLELLDELQLSDRTIVAITSDHGEAFMEHGFTGHGKDLFDELVHVPLMLSGPGVPSGLEVDAQVPFHHLARTLMHLGQIEDANFPAGPLLFDSRQLETPISEPVFLSTDTGRWIDEAGVDRGVVGTMYSLRQETWSYHWVPGDEGPEDDLERHYDLVSDPFMLDDHGGRYPVLSERYQNVIQDWLARSAESSPRGTISAGGGTLEMLRALGYIDGD